jgi:hypothetical protein
MSGEPMTPGEPVEESLPQRDLQAIVLNPKTPAEVLERVLEHPGLTPDIVLALIRHPSTPRLGMAHLAETAGGAILEVLLSNLERLLRWVDVLEALLRNPAVPPIKHPGIQQQIEAAHRKEAEGGRRKSLLLQIKELSIGHRLALAKKGNKEVRMLLIKDSNEMIALEVISSPRITDGEILSIAQMRDVSDKVLRQIASNRKYRQNKQIILALLNNPKTPVGVSLSLGINNLTERELTDLSKNRNVPGVVCRAAKQILDRRKQPAHPAGGGH